MYLLPDLFGCVGSQLQHQGAVVVVVRTWLPHVMCNLSSPTRDQINVPCIAQRILNHWTTEEVPRHFINSHNSLDSLSSAWGSVVPHVSGGSSHLGPRTHTHSSLAPRRGGRKSQAYLGCSLQRVSGHLRALVPPCDIST